MPPILTISEVISITCVSSRISGKINDLGDVRDDLVTKGVCWSTTPNPTINDNKTRDGGCYSLSFFASTLTGLNSGTTYYVRAYVTNGAYTAYSNQLTFNTLPTVKPSMTAAIFPLSLSCTGVIVA